LLILIVTNASLDWYNFSMIKPQLTEEQREALEQHHGLLQVDEAGHKYVLMSMEVYRELMGVGTDEELQASLKALQAGLADIDAGRTRPFRDVLAELESE
jgi:PHD/YefM family antitoxin component YafN of YafNO toxin-antitoxin module